MNDYERKIRPNNSEGGAEVPAQITEALATYQRYLDGDKADNSILRQAYYQLISYGPADEAGSAFSDVSFSHKRQLLRCLDKPRGGDWTQATLGIFSLKLEANQYPTAIAENIKRLVADASRVARELWDNI